MKRILALLSAGILFLSAGVHAAAETAGIQPDVRFIVNGEETVLPDGTGLLEADGKIYVSLEALISLMGGECVYGNGTVTVIIGQAPIETITGTWTCPLQGSAAVLTIVEDGGALLEIGKNAYRCAWYLEGDTFTLTQKGIPVTGTYDGRVIDLSLSGIKMTFTR